VALWQTSWFLRCWSQQQAVLLEQCSCVSKGWEVTVHIFLHRAAADRKQMPHSGAEKATAEERIARCHTRAPHWCHCVESARYRSTFAMVCCDTKVAAFAQNTYSELQYHTYGNMYILYTIVYNSSGTSISSSSVLPCLRTLLDCLRRCEHPSY
jgi:hypothetical protein